MPLDFESSATISAPTAYATLSNEKVAVMTTMDDAAKKYSSWPYKDSYDYANVVLSNAYPVISVLRY